MAPTARRAKRALDLAASLAGLVLLLPLVPLIALAIRLETRGPALRTELRVGMERRRPDSPTRGGRRVHDTRGRLFTRWRFHTRKVDAEGLVRRTWVGVLLEGTGLVGWPQLLNVLLGEMSLVGPRPVSPAFADRIHREFPPLRLGFSGLRPGIFGLGQLAGPETEDGWARLREALLSDRVYERRVLRCQGLSSLCLDLALIGRSMWRWLRPRTPRPGNDVVRIEYPAQLGQVDLCPRELSAETPAGLGAEVTEGADGLIGFWYPRRGSPTAERIADDDLVAELCDELSRSSAPAALELGKALRPGPVAEPDVLRVEAPTSLDDCHHLCRHLQPLWRALAGRAEDPRFAATMSVLLIEGLATASRLASTGTARISVTITLEARAVRLAFDPIDDQAALPAAAEPEQHAA